MNQIEVRGLKFNYHPGDKVHSDARSIEKSHFMEIDRFSGSDVFKEIGSDIFVDVGCCHGESTMLMLRKGLFRNALCFEPVRENYHALCMNIRDNGLDGRVHAERMAIWYEDAQMVLCKGNPGGATIRSLTKGTESWKREGCIYGSLANEIRIYLQMFAVPAEASLIWMDCQGAEERILLTEGDELTKLCKHFYVEVHNPAIDQFKFARIVNRLFSWCAIFGNQKSPNSNPEKIPIRGFSRVYLGGTKYQWVLFGVD